MTDAFQLIYIVAVDPPISALDAFESALTAAEGCEDISSDFLAHAKERLVVLQEYEALRGAVERKGGSESIDPTGVEAVQDAITHCAHAMEGLIAGSI